MPHVSWSSRPSSTILVADGDPARRRLLRTTLAVDNRAVLEAADAREVTSLLLRHRPSVVVLAPEMPDGDGVALAHAIKAAPRLMETRVVLLGDAPALAANRATGSPADLCLPKPFSPLTLLSAVDEWIASSEVASRDAQTAEEGPPEGS
jgi:CheY-like chemotaxis protein